MVCDLWYIFIFISSKGTFMIFNNVQLEELVVRSSQQGNFSLFLVRFLGH